MVAGWLLDAARTYNAQSRLNRDAYTAVLLMPVETLATILDWTFQSLPDEILVGMDPDHERANPKDVVEAYSGADHTNGLFAGQGQLLGQPHLVNRGDSYEVHHVPEEWVDGLFAADRGSRGGRFTHWLHTHPNAPALPSEADADAAQWTEGCDMILGVRFTPEGHLPWFDDIDGVRRPLSELDDSTALGRARTGHLIHGLEIICFHRSGFGINLVLTDESGNAIE
jgi:proteasome lid subunit RPN8/RPN11|tara:strand:- start:4132 stop:4809 length:678 start_codon:yes stop_codon:yes gene_type:complete